MRTTPWGLAAVLFMGCSLELEKPPGSLLPELGEETDEVLFGDDDDDDDGETDETDETDTTETTDTTGADDDGDGLSNAQELEIGSDPNDPDTDGDGWEDGEEIEENTNPLAAGDRPYIGGYGVDACRDNVSPTGFNIGGTVENFGLLDQHGDTVYLHSFCDREVLLVSAAFW